MDEGRKEQSIQICPNFSLAGNDADDDSDGSESEREDRLDLKDMFDNVPHDYSDLQADVQGDDNLESQ